MEMEMEVDPPVVTDTDVVSALTNAEGADPGSKVAALEGAFRALQVSAPLPDAQIVMSKLSGHARSAHQDVASLALSMLGLYAERMKIETAAVAHDAALQAHALRLARTFAHASLPLALERLGDARSKTKTSAGEAVHAILILVATLPLTPSSSSSSSSFGGGGKPDTPLDVAVAAYVELGLHAKQPRVREGSLTLLARIKQDCRPLPLRPFTSSIVATLADADVKVREAARTAVVSLFTRASPLARTELHRELERQGIRRQLVELLLTDISAGAAANATHATAAAYTGHAPGTADAFHHDGTPELAAQTPAQPSEQDPDEYKASIAAPVESPTFVSSPGELERMFMVMEPHFQGIETEKNWQLRQADVLRLRGLLNHPLPPNVRDALPLHLKVLQDGITKTAGTLRTTLAIQSIALVEELSAALNEELGHSGIAESFLSSMLRVSAGTKKITVNAAQTAISAILQCVPFRPSFFHTLQFGLTDKNTQVRLALAGYIKTLLHTYRPGSRSLAATSANGTGRAKFWARNNLEAITGAIGHELADSNKDVRAVARKAFWLLHVLPSGRSDAEALLSKLDAKTKGTLMNDTTAHEEAEIDTSPEKRPPSVTSTGSTVRRARGGASLALLKAKRAASARMAQERTGKPATEIEQPAVPAEPVLQWDSAPSMEHERISSESKVEQWQRGMPSSPLLSPSADISMDIGSPSASAPQQLGSEPGPSESASGQSDIPMPDDQAFGVPVETPSNAEPEPTITLGESQESAKSPESDGGGGGRGSGVAGIDPAGSDSTTGPTISPRKNLSPDEKPAFSDTSPSVGGGNPLLPDVGGGEARDTTESKHLQPLSVAPDKHHSRRRTLRELEPVDHWIALLRKDDPHLNFFRKLSRWASYPAKDDHGNPHPLAQNPAVTGELLGLLFDLARTKAKARAPEPALATLIVLHRLTVHHTLDSISLSGQQDQLVHLALDPILAQEPLRYATPCEGILNAWASQTDSVLCLRTLANHCPSPEDQSDSAAAVLKLVLQVIARLLEAMPAEVIEDEFPRLRVPLRTGLLHKAPDVRAAANATVLSAAQELQSTAGLFEALAPLTQSQQDLILYYFAKRRGVGR